MATRIILARHGESIVNVVGLASDDTENNPLTELGRTQAASLASSLRDEPLSRVYTSTVERARETGGIVADALGLPIAIEPDIHEILVGIHAGERFPESYERSIVDFRTWLAEEDLSHGYEGGENGLQVAERASRALTRIAERHDGESVLVVSHGGTILFTVSTLCDNIRLRSLYAHQPANCGTVELEYADGAWTCLAWAGLDPAELDDEAEGNVA